MTTHPDDVRVPLGSSPGPVPTGGAPALRPPSDLVRSVSRALSVLEVVSVAGVAMSAKAIARRTGLNLSTTYHLLHTLCWEGYLVRLPSGDYGPGAGILRRYQDLVSTLGAPVPVRRVLHWLTTRTGLTGYLGRLAEGRITLTDVLHGPDSPWVDRLAPGYEEAARATPLFRALRSAGATGNGSDDTALIIEDGRLQPDVSCAAVTARRAGRHPHGERPDAAAADELWAIGLSGPLGCFSGRAPALRALLRARQQLAAS